jgi:hypothetical protein
MWRYAALLPPGIFQEVLSAVQRTGWTPALRKAVDVLSTILKMSPQEFERKSAELYQRSDM